MQIEEPDILFIINPKIGIKKVVSITDSIKNKGLSFRITKDLNDLDQVMSEEIDNFKVFVAVGGDGTVNSLAKYLINKKQKSLAVLPVGSGNGFAYELGFHYDLDKLIRHISTGKMIELDVLRINDSEFINVAGIGLDAEVAHRFHKFRKRGLPNYVISSIISYFKNKPFQATVCSEDFEISDTFQMISITNTRQYGSNAFISPGSSPFDGQYEIAAVKPIPLIGMIPFVYKLFKGNLRNSKYINYFPCTGETSIKTDCKKFHIDGDPLFSEGNYEIKIKKNHLNVIKTR